MPFGESNLYYEKDGYHRSQVEQVVVATAANTEVPAIDLVLSTGAAGLILLADGGELVS